MRSHGSRSGDGEREGDRLACIDVARRLAADGGERAALEPAIARHLAACPPCRDYAAQLDLIGSAARDLAGRFSAGREEVRRLTEELLDPRLKQG